MKAFLAALPLLIAPMLLVLPAQAQLTRGQRQQITAWIDNPSFMRLDCDDSDPRQGNGDENWWDQGETAQRYFQSGNRTRDVNRFRQRFAVNLGQGEWIYGNDRDVIVYSNPSSTTAADPALWLIYEKPGARDGKRRLIEVGGKGRLPEMDGRVERYLICLHGKQKNLTLLMND